MDTDTMTIVEARAQHLEWLEAEEKSPHTISFYKHSWNGIQTFLSESLGREPLVSDLTPENMKRLFLARHGDVDAGTWGVYRGRIGEIGKFLMSQGFLSYGRPPVDGIPQKVKKTVKKKSEAFKDDQFARLLEVAKSFHMRDYFQLLFQRLTGRRISEVIRTRWDDVDWDRGVIYFDDTKGRKYGEKMPLTLPVRLLLETWLEFYEKDVQETYLVEVDVRESNWFIFPACKTSGRPKKGRPHKRRPLNPTASHKKAVDTFKAITVEAGLYLPQKGTHRVRKTMATNMKRVADASDRKDAWDLTKQALGHRKVETTIGYVDPDQEFSRFEEFMQAHAVELVSDELIAAIPFLSSLRSGSESPAPTAPAAPSAAVSDVEILLAEMDDIMAPRRRNLA